MISWLHLLWIVPLILLIGYCIGGVMSANKLDEARDEWGRELNELMARAKRAEAELWRKAHE